MRIVQLSDIHVGGFFKQNIFDLLVNEINSEIKPDYHNLGDFTDDGVIVKLKNLMMK